MKKKGEAQRGKRPVGRKLATINCDGKGVWTVVVRNDVRKNGSTAVDFTFLPNWLGETQTHRFIRAVERVSSGYVSATPAYSIRAILIFWCTLSVKHNWSLPTPKSDSAALLKLVSNLRHEFFMHEYKRGVKLSSAATQWRYFVPFLRELISVGAIPRITHDSPLIESPPRRAVLMRRQDAITNQIATGIEPATFKRDSDSYNDELLEPISIIHSNERYLKEYQLRLSHALEAIQQCALRELDELERLRAEGKRLIADTDYLAIKQICDARSCGGRRSFKDSRNGLHFFDENGGHPNLIGNLLSVIHHEMDGIPRPVEKQYLVEGRRRTITVEKGRHHWQFVEWYGKSRLLPYLGLMTSSAAVVCVVLLMIEHPRLNTTSLLRAELEDGDGRQILLIPATAGSSEQTRLVVKKPRAGEEKDVLLTPLSKRVMQFILEWTAPVRAALHAAGEHEAAKKLWVGMHSIDYRLMYYSEKSIRNGLRMKEENRSWGHKANKNRIIPFVDRHSELSRWAEKLTFRALRVTAGVLIYLRTDGDLIATARAFGHRNIKTTISHYVPDQLRLAIYERQIRRHQNLLIAAAADSVPSALSWTDFRTTEELHEFLCSVFSSFGAAGDIQYPIADAIAGFINPKAKEVVKMPNAGNTTGRMILSSDPRALGVAILYREHLRPASSSYLDRPDVVTKVRPRFWCEFIDCISGELPHALHEVKELVLAARRFAQSRAIKVLFPPLT